MTDYFQRRPPHQQADIDELQVGDNEDLLDKLDKQQKQERIRAALAKLTPEQSQVVMLKYYEGWNNREVSRRSAPKACWSCQIITASGH